MALKQGLAFLLLAAVLAACSHDIPKSMGTIGDSISGGILAEHSLVTSTLSTSELQDLLLAITDDQLEPGESNWSTGKDQANPNNFSLADRIESFALSDFISKLIKRQRVMGYTQLKRYNVSSPFAKIEDFTYQISALSERYQNDQLVPSPINVPDYITVFLGLNDLCRPNESLDFRGTLRAGLVELGNRNPNGSIQVVKIPTDFANLPFDARLKDLAIGNSTLTCSLMRRAYKLICPGLFQYSENPNEAVVNQAKLAIKNRIDVYNNAIDEVINGGSSTPKLNRVLKTVNGLSRFKYEIASSVADFKLEPEDLSVDCFHLSKVGQKKLADMAWKDSFWSKTECDPDTFSSPNNSIDPKTPSTCH